MNNTCDVLVIGAGPAGSVAGALLKRRGYRVTILEQQQFPRFSIGESLLPHCMKFIEDAGMMPAVHAGSFQFKDGAAFFWRDQQTVFDFRDKFSEGWATTHQVVRAEFDHVLAKDAERQGVDIRYQHTILSVDLRDPGRPGVHVRLPDGGEADFQARFLLDASGFGRVLARLLDLEHPSGFPVRQAIFTHVMDGIDDPTFDRNKIRVGIHPTMRDIWYWLIPFPAGRCSLGVVGAEADLAKVPGDLTEQLLHWVNEDPGMGKLLARAKPVFPARKLVGYAANVKSLYSPGYALLGNAGEFLDPVFSSGVTIAMKSATLAAAILDRQFRGESVDWEGEYAEPLKKGIDAFRAYVEGWYDGSFQDIIFHPTQTPQFRRMICSVLAGYAWDQDNPFAREAKRRLGSLAEYCRMEAADRKPG